MESFTNDLDYQDVVNMNVFQIGELSNHLSNEIKKILNQIPWDKICGVRNVMAHAYITIDTDIIWNTINNDIPILKSELLKFLSDL